MEPQNLTHIHKMPSNHLKALIHHPKLQVPSLKDFVEYHDHYGKDILDSFPTWQSPNFLRYKLQSGDCASNFQHHGEY